MEPSVIIRIGQEALLLALVIAAPPVLVALATGLVVSLLQAATQIQEQTLTFVPKMVAVAAVLVFGGLWMFGRLIQFGTGLLHEIPALVR